MTDPELAAELARVHGKVAAAKRALKGVMGQQRLATQLLADLQDEFDSLQVRLEHTATGGTADDHERDTVLA